MLEKIFFDEPPPDQKTRNQYAYFDEIKSGHFSNFDFLLSFKNFFPRWFKTTFQKKVVLELFLSCHTSPIPNFGNYFDFPKIVIKLEIRYDKENGLQFSYLITAKKNKIWNSMITDSAIKQRYYMYILYNIHLTIVVPQHSIKMYLSSLYKLIKRVYFCKTNILTRG